MYNPLKIEKKWQRVWEKQQIYYARDKVKGKKNFYHLVMFPYPSGDLHMGHWFNYGPADVYARFKRMQGLNVMSPIGFDAFGLPAENAAIKRGLDPKLWTYNNIRSMRKQIRSLGTVFDWSREIITSEPIYYKWTQWIFLKLYKAGLAKKEKVLANWCPKDKTIIANEQVVDGRCERDGALVEQRFVEQWVFKITDYAQKLLDGLDKLDWPETTKILQRNWIGKSFGTVIQFRVKNSKYTIPVFTTRPDTIFGATFMVLAPEHKLVKKITRDKYLGQVNSYLEKTKLKTERQRLAEDRKKTGAFTGTYAINPATGEEIPIWISDFVLPHYGTGAVMSVPAHDQRDYDFAKRFKLKIKPVIKPKDKEWNFAKSAFEDEGILVDSKQFSGYKSEDAREEITEWLIKKSLAKRQVNYKLHDWIVSRQRYWGAPIPVIYCKRCGILPVLEKDLPVKLPKLTDFKPPGTGKSPLAKAKEWVNVKCWKCFGPAQRETDTMDTFVDSAWYFLRYADPKNKKKFAASKKLASWLPVNMYIGGQEHATKHLLYARFITKVLFDLGYLKFDEPFLSMRHQGLILGPDGQKMSKSKGNVVDPDKLVKEFGADTVRMYLCFMAPYDQGGPWNPNAIKGVYRFLGRVWNLAKGKRKKEKGKKMKKEEGKTGEEKGKSNKEEYENLQKVIHKTIKKVGEDIDNFRFNTAVSELMKLLNTMEEYQDKGFKIKPSDLKIFLKLISPFAPYITEELWHSLFVGPGKFKSIHNEKWPKFDPKLVKEEMISLIVQVNGKTRDVIEASYDLTESQAKELVLPSEKVKKYIRGKQIKKIVYIPNKLINLVV